MGRFNFNYITKMFESKENSYNYYSLRIIYISFILFPFFIGFLLLFTYKSMEILNVLIFPVLVSRKRLHLIGKFLCAIIVFILIIIVGVFLFITTNVIFLICYLCLVCAVLYYCLFRWRKLSFSYFSYLCFNINFLILCVFIFGTLNIFLRSHKPIYIEDLPQYSYYKYAGFLSIFILGGIFYFIVRYFFPNFKNNSLWSKLIFPHLKEEFRLILYTWNESFWGNVCSNIIDSIFKSKISLWFFVITHSLCFYGIKFIQAVLFCNFVFFHGDLRWNLYLLPLSFLSWILRFFEYYLKTFFHGSCEYIRLLLDVSPKNSYHNNNGLALITGDELDFRLTSLALEKGFTKKHLFMLGNEWLQMNHLEVLLTTYEKNLYWFNLLIITLRILTWSYLSFNYFFTSYSMLGKSGPFFTRMSLILLPLRTRSPSEVHRAVAMLKKDLEKETNGAVTPGHLVIVDFSIKDENGKVLVEGGLTHGKGSAKNPSSPVHPSEDLNGPHPKGQSATFTKTPTFVHAKYFHSTHVPNSKDFLEKPECKVNIAKVKHDHKEEEYP